MHVSATMHRNIGHLDAYGRPFYISISRIVADGNL